MQLHRLNIHARKNETSGDQTVTRKAHKNRVFIISPLSAQSIWVKVEFWVKVKFWVKVELWVKIISKVTVVVKANVCVIASGFARWSMSVCVCLHLASPDVPVDSADGASSGLIR